jgi:DNA helicase HerA-like ATPase
LPKRFSIKPPLAEHEPVVFFGDPQGRRNEHILLGELAEIGPKKKVNFDVSAEHVVAIVGKRGSGKSYTLGSIVESLCTTGKETTISRISQNRGILLFDTLNIYWTTEIPLEADSPKAIIREQNRSLSGWDISPESLEVCVWVPSGFRSETTPDYYSDFYINTSDFEAEDWADLLGVDLMRDRMGQLVGDAYHKVTVEGWSNRDEFHRPQSDYGMENLINCVESDSELLDAYHSETVRAVLQQLRSYRRFPVFRKAGTSLTNLIVPGQLSVLELSHLPDSVRGVLVSVLVRKLFQARARASEDQKRLLLSPDLSPTIAERIQDNVKNAVPPAWIAVDEAQNILPAGRKTTTTDVLVKLVREGRNFGLSFLVTSQQPGAIDSRIMAQVDTLIVHKLAVQGDLEAVKHNLKANLPKEVKYGHTALTFESLVRGLDVGQALVSNTETERAFLINVRPRVSVHGGFEK